MGSIVFENIKSLLELEKRKDGPDPDALALVEARLANAEAQLEFAHAQLEAELDAVDLELEKYVVRAPIAGVVITRNIQPGELIHHIALPNPIPERQEFGKVGVRNAMVISTVMACVTRAEDGQTRVALGSVGPTTLRARRAEEMISSVDRPSPAALQEFTRLVREDIRPITDHRSTESYRRQAAGVLARRLLERCLR